MMGLYMYSSQLGTDPGERMLASFILTASRLFNFRRAYLQNFPGLCLQTPSKSMLNVVSRTMQARPTLSQPHFKFCCYGNAYDT